MVGSDVSEGSELSVVVGSEVTDPVLPPPPAPSPSAGVLVVLVGSSVVELGGGLEDDGGGELVVVGDEVVHVVVEVHVVVDRELIEDVAGGVVPPGYPAGPPAGRLLPGLELAAVDDGAVVDVGMSPAAAAPLTVI